MNILNCKSCPLRKTNQYPPYEKTCGHPDGSQRVEDELHELCPLKEGALILTNGEGVIKTLLKELSKLEGKKEVKWDNSTNKYIIRNA